VAGWPGYGHSRRHPCERRGGSTTVRRPQAIVVSCAARRGWRLGIWRQPAGGARAGRGLTARRVVVGAGCEVAGVLPCSTSVLHILFSPPVPRFGTVLRRLHGGGAGVVCACSWYQDGAADSDRPSFCTGFAVASGSVGLPQVTPFSALGRTRASGLVERSRRKPFTGALAGGDGGGACGSRSRSPC